MRSPAPGAVRPPLPRRLAESLRAAVWLDRIGDPLHTVLHTWLSDDVRGTLRGGWLGHPAHPMLTDAPIGLWTSAVLLDALDGDAHDRAVDRLLRLGLLAALPTAATGLLDWSEAERASRRPGLVHAAANLIALTFMGAATLTRRRDRGAARRLTLLALSALGVGAYLGGHLTYAEGVGVGAPPGHEAAGTVGRGGRRAR